MFQTEFRTGYLTQESSLFHLQRLDKLAVVQAEILPGLMLD